MKKLCKNYFIANNCLTINSYFSFIGVTCYDPIEQYDLGLLNVNGYTIYPIYFHVVLIVGLLLGITSSVKINFFGYIHYKIYNFLREAFLSVCGPERQILFPYFYYIFFFLLLSNIFGMIP